MQSIRRAHRILRALADSPDGLTVTQLSAELQLPPSTVHRLLAVLQEEQFVSRPDGKSWCYLGPESLRIGLAARRPRVTSSLRAAEVVSELADTFGQGALLVELRGRRAESVLQCGLADWAGGYAGDLMPFHAVAAARALLIDMDRAEVMRLLSEYEFLPRRARTPGTVTELLQRVDTVRRRGHETVYGEFVPAVWEFAAPVRGGSGQVLAGLAVVWHEARTTAEQAVRISEQVARAAREISQEFGYAC
ncbi:IclR family transcriptional regulator [Streptomyces tendae]|uniref:IclR family transcriptional regulator n=1 Tax=Streptomyces tendae TaxID=1932 RepID=UPI003712137C